MVAIIRVISGSDGDIRMIDKAVEVFRNGGIVIFPTDTVWGIGVRADDQEAVKKFYKIKKREPGKPSAILVADLAQVEEWGEFSIKVRNLEKKYWPGALTIIVPAKEGSTAPLCQGYVRGTVGLRVPDHELTRELCKRVGPIMAGSANFGGQSPPMRKEELDPELVKLVDLVIEGECGGQESSTVVDTTQEPWRIIRQGPIKI